MNNNLKVLAINSFPANGNAGLKMVMSVLGTHVIPVPTLLLSGIGNMKGHARYAVPFEEMLNGTLQLAEENGYKLVVYVGYLGNALQAGLIAKALEKYAHIINFVLIDPVCGDNGKSYTAEEVIASWEILLRKAAIALPNITEVALLSGFRGVLDLSKPEIYISAFQQKYPALNCIITGMITGNQIINRWIQEGKQTDFTHLYHPKSFSGTGDTFASLFVSLNFFRNLPTEQAIREAGRVLEILIEKCIEAGNNELSVSDEQIGITEASY